MSLAAPVAPIGAHPLLILLLQISLLLGAAVLLGRLAARLSMPAVVGELTAGVLLGPTLLGHVSPNLSEWLLPHDKVQMNILDAVGQFGVLLLVGLAGMGIDLGLVRRKGVTAAWVSAGGLLLPLGAGVALGFALPAALVAPGADRTSFAWFVGVAMCVTAIPVIAKILMEMDLLHRNIGQLTVSAAAVDDVVGWLLFSVVSAMVTTGVHGPRVALSVALLFAVVLFTATLGRVIVTVTMRTVARSPEPGTAIVAAVLLMLLPAAATHALGMEAILGALLGGILIGNCGWTDRTRLAPLRAFVMAVLAPLFFATAGLRVDLTVLTRLEVLGAGIVVLLAAVLGKLIGVYAAARAGRLGHWEAMALGGAMNARGVIGVIIAMAGLRLGVLNTEMYTIVLLVAMVTSLMAPPILRYSVRHIHPLAEEEARKAAQSFAGHPVPAARKQ